MNAAPSYRTNGPRSVQCVPESEGPRGPVIRCTYSQTGSPDVVCYFTSQDDADEIATRYLART